MQDGNYIKINRSILEWEWYKNINTCRLFLHMLLKANWKNWRFEGKEIKRGSFVSSIKNLALETELTEREVRTGITHLKKTGELTSKSTNKYTIFTVVNYNLYQAKDKQIDEQETNNRHSNDILTTTIEEKKEGKEGNIESVNAPERFEEFWSVYPRQTGRYLAEQAYAILITTTESLTESDLITAAKNYADTCRILKTAEQFIKNPANFLNENTWVDYLSGTYKPPAVQQPKPKQNKFNNFEQRDYDYANIEKQLQGFGL